MANEITAEELAAKLFEKYPGLVTYETWLAIAVGTGSPLASLQAERRKSFRASIGITDDDAAVDHMVAAFEGSPQVNDAQSTGIEYLGNTVTSEAPERVRCWAIVDKATGRIIEVHTTFRGFSLNMPYTVTEGYFTAKGSTDD